MPTQTQIAQAARQILLLAMSEEFGLRVRIHTPGDMMAPALRGRAILYRFKNEDPDFSNLQIRIDPDDPDNSLWIIKGEWVAREAESTDENPRSRPKAEPIDIEF